MPDLRRRAPETTRGLDAALAAGQLSTSFITGRTVAAATPTTVVAGVVPVAIAVTSGNFPLLFIVIAAVYLLFCVGYLAASRMVPADTASGAFYNLVSRGLSQTMGVGAGWVAVAAYTALTLGLYGLIGAILGPPLSSLLGITLPWQAVAIPAALLVGWLGLLKIEVGTRFLMVLVTCEVLMITVVTAANWLHPAADTSPLDALNPHQLTTGAPVVAAQLALAVLGYIGTELTVVHTRDARDSHRGVARATVATIAVLTVLYVAAPAGLSVTLGVDGVVHAAQADPGGLFVSTARTHLGELAATIVQILFAGSLLAGAIAFHGATAFYCVHLGRDHAAPRALARVGRKHGSATVASLSQTVLAVAAIITVSVLGADPVQTLFYYGGTAGAVGILALLALTALAIAVILLRQRTTPSSTTAHGAATPAELDHLDDSTGRLGAAHRRWAAAAAIPATIVLAVLLTIVMLHLDTLLGVTPDSPLPFAVQLTYLAVFIAGVTWALCRRSAAVRHTAPAGTDRR
ncbi:APC family permease [Amycolatopsis australiensis]|uniref:Amino acid transporter n=1 Tax=Amycolatopsis australiensis TaxID=546364 RepID=A0A1K1RS27_9PSEU|nr:APC family permease [Amycolatopsis australiensis]SFW74682.1 Amino acid transporter [Amycolatopsis australiensis]